MFNRLSLNFRFIITQSYERSTIKIYDSRDNFSKS